MRPTVVDEEKKDSGPPKLMSLKEELKIEVETQKPKTIDYNE